MFISKDVNNVHKMGTDNGNNIIYQCFGSFNISDLLLLGRCAFETSGLHGCCYTSDKVFPLSVPAGTM
jgi:hypothetical protein